jgi:RNA polymerase sigma-70 factor, ECF subfamily
VKSPPVVLLACSELEPGLPCPVVAQNDAAERTGVEWRIERVPQARERSVSLPESGSFSARPGPTLAEAPREDLGEAASAEQAYQLWKERVWRFACRLGVPNEQLEDATQDVFAAVFRRWNDFRGQSSRRTWVLGFVPRVASSYRRRQRRPAEPAREPTSEGALAAVPSAADDPFESTARQEAKRLVSSFLDGLPEINRQLFVLVELEDTSVVEAAAILELGPRRAYNIQDRALRALEATLVRYHAADNRRLP